MMKYRLLAFEEWDRLKEIVDTKFIPVPESATAAVAEDEEGRLVGVLFLQLTMHMEPLVLSAPNVSFKRLYETLYAGVRSHTGLHFYAFADSDVVAMMAEHVGLKKTAYQVFEGEVV